VGSGVTIKQNYSVVETRKLKPYSSISRSVNMSVATDVIDVKQQRTSIMANLINSLDATSLSFVVNEMNYHSGGKFSIYCIHDCYATTVDMVPLLMKCLINTYMRIYFNSPYLENLHKHFMKILREYVESNPDLVLKDGNTLYNLKTGETRILANVDFLRNKENDNFVHFNTAKNKGQIQNITLEIKGRKIDRVLYNLIVMYYV
jgi:DNA-directed RNA polymerase